MTQKEYERIIQEATDASIAAQAEKNAAEAAAVGSAISNAGMATGQQMSGGVGEAPEWETEQEQQKKRQAIEDAVNATTMPAGEIQQENKSQSGLSSDSKLEDNKLSTDDNTSTGSNTDSSADDNLSKAQSDLIKANEDYIKGVADAHEMQNKAFADMVNDYYNEKKAREEEMRRQEQANMLSTMGSSFAELGAGLANLFTVGTGASNQQYKNYSADWMKKAEQDIQDNRKRRENMYDMLQRLKLQQEQLRATGRLEEMKMRQAAAKDAFGIAKDTYDRAWREKTYADTRADKEWQKGITEQQVKNQERAQDRQDKATDASIAQGWARIRNDQKAREMNMRLYGYVPDKDAPGGFRYDPDQAAKGAGSRSSSSSSSGGGTSSIISYPIIDKDGEVNIAHLKTHEMEAVLLNAREAIKTDLGENGATDFEKEFRRAGDDKTKNAVLLKWMSKSKTCGDMIRAIDANYRGIHGLEQTPPNFYDSAGRNQTLPNFQDNAAPRLDVNPRTGLNYK